MIQMRWFSTNNTQPKLQYRVKQNVTVYAGMPTEQQKLETAKYEWSDWIDVPNVHRD